jgi:hypothetical protein
MKKKKMQPFTDEVMKSLEPKKETIIRPQGKVRLFHGPSVSQSTYRRIQKRNAAWDPIAFGFFIFMCIVVLSMFIK